MGPMLRDAMKFSKDGLDLRHMLSEALHMGDECHNRNIAGTRTLIQALTPLIEQTDYSTKEKVEVFDFVASSDYFSGPTWMGLCKCAMDAAHGIENSTIVTTMARNGVEFGIRVSGMDWRYFRRFAWFYFKLSHPFNTCKTKVLGNVLKKRTRLFIKFLI